MHTHTHTMLPITATMPTLYFSLDFTVPVTTGHIDRTVLASLSPVRPGSSQGRGGAAIAGGGVTVVLGGGGGVAILQLFS